MIISDRIAKISASPTLAMAAKAAAMKTAGENILSMSLGEPDFPTPAHVKQAVKEAVDADLSHYGPVPGTPGLRAAAAKYMSSFAAQGRDVFAAEDIIVSVGAKQSICNAIETLVGKGDEVILPTPCWVSYTEMVKLAEGVPVMIRTTMADDFILKPEALEAAITPRTKLIVLCTPNNPTGAVYSEADIDALAKVLMRHPDVAIIADEIYNQICYEGVCASWASRTELLDRLIIVNGVSKAFAMTGYRIGWLACKDQAFIKACTRLQGQQITCATMVAQYAAQKALEGDLSCVADMTKAFQRRRDLIVRLAKDIPGFKVRSPKGAFYLFPDVTALFGKRAGDKIIGNADELCEYLLTDGHVACVSGAAFGEPTCLRISYACSEEQIVEAMQRIRTAIEQLK
ncbi:MAG: pyridoxal phosphate-dependent aminotransferase [Paludibacteraceae bacterium]|nr:pyridoxal phosphate-dependent aminotransferase [Paludibacteraceae bacterium]